MSQAVAPVRIAGGGLGDDLRAIKVVWKRELIRFSRNRLRIVTALAQPVLFLFVLGTGLSSLVQAAPGADGAHINLETFMFPGVVAMTVLFTAIFSAVSIVWDREFGFLREMLVAPVRRPSLIIGKCLGGATVATLQGLLMLVMAGLVHVPYTAPLFFTLIGEMALTAFMLTAFGIMLAARIAQVESFQIVMQFFVLPMFFLSGALFPLAGLPGWLEALTRIDPLTYAVNPMRVAVFRAMHVTSHSSAALARLAAVKVTWDGNPVPLAAQLGIVALLGLIMLVVATVQFSRTD